MPPAVRRSLAAILVAIGALALPAAAFAGADDNGLAPIDPSSENAHAISDIYWFLLVVAAIVFLAVSVPLLVFVVRYRSGGRPRTADGPQVHGSTRLELAWTAVPVLILIAIASFTFYKLKPIDDPAGAAAQPPGSTRVEARQFYWQFVYPNGAISINTLRLPVDRVTTLAITAPPGDVIHSFWVPELDGKRDAIPGNPNSLKLRPDQIGSYTIRCAELCGLQHAKMNGVVEVVPEAEYQQWIAQRARAQEAAPVTLGKQIFDGACATCHGVGGKGFIGPALAGNPLVANPQNVERVVRNGVNTMPAVGQGWSDTELKALTTYLAATISKQGSTSGSSG
jgi:cytochrome c oxidase subunit II